MRQFPQSSALTSRSSGHLFLVAKFIDEAGHVEVDRLADSFGTSKTQLAETTAVGKAGVLRDYLDHLALGGFA